MGIFLEQVTLVNRTKINLTVLFDGQSKTLKPGKNIVPAVVVSFAKNQNPIMGSHDPYNPHMSGGRYLVGVLNEDGTPLYGEETEPLTEEEWASHLSNPCRTDERAAFADKYGNDPKARLVTLNSGKRSTANSVSEAGGPHTGTATFGRD